MYLVQRWCCGDLWHRILSSRILHFIISKDFPEDNCGHEAPTFTIVHVVPKVN